MSDKIKIGISTCLLGEKVRYDGQSKPDHYLIDTVGRFVEWVPVCPEVECGLPVPREAMHLEGTPDKPVLITTKTRKDITPRMTKWIKKRLKELETEGLCGYIFKTKSPSSGMRDIKYFKPDGSQGKQGPGIFARAFMEHFPYLPVEDNGRFHDPGLRENFIERVFALHRWNQFLAVDGSVKGLIEYHTQMKYTLMAHSPKKQKELGKLLADTKALNKKELMERYIADVLKALKMEATVKKNTNVLQHMMGYFRNLITPDEKDELGSLIEQYHTCLIPLIVPVTLINHYTRKYEEPYLKKQFFLNPFPAELMLRNHV